MRGISVLIELSAWFRGARDYLKPVKSAPQKPDAEICTPGTPPPRPL
jgi:hypothetical protein